MSKSKEMRQNALAKLDSAKPPAVNNTKELGQLAFLINDIYRSAGESMARAQIEAGKVLLKARALFKGDNEFGKWREANTPIKNSQTALNLMKLAEANDRGELSDTVIEGMTKTAILAYLGAPTNVREKVEKQV